MFSCIVIWAKNLRNFLHANQETNASIESYHFHIKSHYLSDHAKKMYKENGLAYPYTSS